MKQFEYFSFSPEKLTFYMLDIAQLGLEGWQLVDRIKDNIIMMRELNQEENNDILDKNPQNPSLHNTDLR